MEEKISYIESLLEQAKLNPFGEDRYLISAVLNTIEVKQLILLYLSTTNSAMKNSLDYHLSRRFSESSLNAKEFFKYLIKNIGKTDYKIHQRSRALLTYLVAHLPKRYKRRYFNVFSSSNYTSDIKAALKISDQVWKRGSENIFIDQYLNSGNEKFLLATLNNGEAEVIASRVLEIWEDECLENYIKTKIIRKLTPDYFENLQFLKDLEPDKYLYACAFADKNIEDAELKNLYNSLRAEQKSFGLWCIGKMQNWDFIKNQLNILQ